MSNAKNVIKRIFNPPLWLLLLLVPAAVVLLVYGLSEQFLDTALAYLSYFVSSYTLTAVVCSFPRLLRTAAKGFWEIPVIQKINRDKIGHLFLNDITFRGTASIYQGFVINTVYAAFRGITAYLYRSVWFAAIAAYYLFLGAVRFALVVRVRRLKQCKDFAGQLIFEFRGYRVCGFLMLLLNAGMAGMMVLMIRDNLHYEYPGYVIYLSALYTFYTAITATVNVFKFRKLKSPILSASKAITFTGAMMSVMALQTAMIARFGDDDALFRQAANTVTGTIVCVASAAIAVYMIFRGTRCIKRLEEENRKGD